jgi:predicted permease
VMAVLVVTTFLLRSLWNIQNVDVGFNPYPVVVAEMRLEHPKYRSPSRIRDFHRELLVGTRRLPGITDVSTSTAAPLRGVDFLWRVSLSGGPATPANMRAVQPGYFRVMNIPLRAGRVLEQRDDEGPAVAVVSESLARILTPDGMALGRLLDLAVPTEVVGIVGDLRQNGPTRPAEPAFYLPAWQYETGVICLVIQTERPLDSVSADIRQLVRALDPTQPVGRIERMSAVLASSFADRYFYTTTAVLFGAIALTLTVGGLFALVFKIVGERTREIAIRMSLGADSASVFRLIFLSGLRPVMLGIGAGLCGAYALMPIVRQFFFEVSPMNGGAYAFAAVLIVALASLACYFPAVRATRIDPSGSLKND